MRKVPDLWSAAKHFLARPSSRLCLASKLVEGKRGLLTATECSDSHAHSATLSLLPHAGAGGSGPHPSDSPPLRLSVPILRRVPAHWDLAIFGVFVAIMGPMALVCRHMHWRIAATATVLSRIADVEGKGSGRTGKGATLI